ncbi:MAG TPA: delta-60 repeat domain-containing protein [Smithellaceae bacterium]|nr:delta-60 repeat domain-containing protein [Smithellaceae bacterium]
MDIGRLKTSISAVLILMALTAVAATASPGTLDNSFNDPYGYALFNDSANARDRGVETAIQADGQILVLGYSYNGVNEDVLLVRYHPDGSLDASFGTGGYVLYNGGANDRGLGLALQSDGKIVAVGYTYTGSQRDVLVLRYNANGTPDASFGTGGKVTYSSPGSATDIGFGVAVQSDGRIVVAGETSNGVNQDALVLRFTAEGNPDTSFAGGGIFRYAGPGGMDRAFALAIQPDGKIVVAGATVVDTKDDVLVFRLNADGGLDATFGAGGIFTYSGAGDNYDYGNALALRADGRIVVLGAQTNGSAYDVLLLQLTPGGTPDTSFGAGGVVLYGDAGGRNDYGLGLAIQADGKIVITGYIQAATDNVLVVRFHGDGALDASFGADGVFTWNGSGNGTDYGQAIALQADGRIVIAGFSHNGVSEDVLVMRLQADDEEVVRCFITLAMAGSGRDDQLATLRNFRDRYLINNHFGRLLSRLYYAASGPLAALLERHDFLKPVARGILTPVVWAVRYPATMMLMTVSGFMIGLFALARRRI